MFSEQLPGKATSLFVLVSAPDRRPPVRCRGRGTRAIAAARCRACSRPEGARPSPADRDDEFDFMLGKVLSAFARSQ